MCMNSGEYAYGTTDEVKFNIYAGDSNKNLQYSLDGGEYIDFEKFSNYHQASDSTNFFNVSGKYNLVTVRDKDTKDIYLKGVIINNGIESVVIQHAVVGIYYTGSSVKKFLPYGYGDNDKETRDIEISIDNGKTFCDIPSGVQLMYNISGEMFSDYVIVRYKDTQEIIYQTPNVGEVEEEYVYENGKTKISFARNDLDASKTSYEYIIDGEAKER